MFCRAWLGQVELAERFGRPFHALSCKRTSGKEPSKLYGE
jgi:hypothetical protein